MIGISGLYGCLRNESARRRKETRNNATVGGQAVILIHNPGKRELMQKQNVDADPERLLELTDQESRVLGTVLEGAYFQPVASSH